MVRVSLYSVATWPPSNQFVQPTGSRSYLGPKSLGDENVNASWVSCKELMAASFKSWLPLTDDLDHASQLHFPSAAYKPLMQRSGYGESRSKPQLISVCISLKIQLSRGVLTLGSSICFRKLGEIPQRRTIPVLSQDRRCK